MSGPPRGNAVWAALWDALFCLSSALLPFFLGAGIANVVRGVPLNGQGYLFEALWTDLDPRSLNPGILEWYTVLIGGLAFCAVVMHGAHFLALKVEGELQMRARGIASRAWLATVVLTALGTAATFFVRSNLLTNFGTQPWGTVFPIVAIGGLLTARFFRSRRHDGRTLVGSGVFLAGMLASSAFALYPDVLPATSTVNSLTVTNASAPLYGLTVGLAWWMVGMGLAAIYFVLIYRLLGPSGCITHAIQKRTRSLLRSISPQERHRARRAHKKQPGTSLHTATGIHGQHGRRRCTSRDGQASVCTNLSEVRVVPGHVFQFCSEMNGAPARRFYPMLCSPRGGQSR